MSFTDRGGWWVVAQAIMLLLFVVALLFTESVDGIPGLGYLRVVGVLLVVAASVMSIWAAVLMGRYLTPYPAPLSGAMLLDRGPYRLVRHPMYGSLCIGALGLALLYASAWAVVVSLLFPIFFTAKAGHEEAMLADELPGYRDYRSEVRRRLIPWLL
jgi:protein-S-isoprenylcysteine O-methyltransferase Ste14